MTERARIAVVAGAIALAAVGFFGAYEWAEAPASQLFGPTLVSGPRDAHVVALTFDDGPNPRATGALLALLERERVRATFFVVGRDVAAYPDLVRREARDGDAIGNHTWDHAHLVTMTAAQIAASLEWTNAAIDRATGTRTALMRPPYGRRDWTVLAEARSLGYTPVMWSVPLADDWQNPPARVIANRVLGSVHNGAIVVLHDGSEGRLCGGAAAAARCDRSSTVAATRLIIDALRRRGYGFLTIPELLALSRESQNST